METLSYDLLIVGAGPAGLSAAIRYTQLCLLDNKQPKVLVLEKGAQVGAHILSGAVFNPRALTELIPEWPNLETPLRTPVQSDHFYFLTAHNAWPLPTPPPMKNSGNYIISLGLLCRWLASYAEKMGVEIYPGFSASKILFDEKNCVVGIETNEMGKNKQGHPKPQYQAGVQIFAQQTLFAEGCRGSLSKQLIQHYELDKNSCPQTYALGVKEIWRIQPEHFESGKVIHTIGWPLQNDTYGGSFIYHWDENLLSIGLVVGLDYQNPYLDPFKELQKLKHHPMLFPILKTGQCISYGARALNEGGWQSLPQSTFAGGMLIGCSAGYMNVPSLKGSHYAMKSGMLAAEALFENFQLPKPSSKIHSYPDKVNQSWVAYELKRARNIRPAFKYGLIAGMVYAAFDTYVFKGKAPWTFANHADYKRLKAAKKCAEITYPKPDGKVSFDKMTALSLANIAHEEDQPCHLIVNDPNLSQTVNWDIYKGPEARYCPAGVYEYTENSHGHWVLQIHASNCLHCKTCDIKDPIQNIHWVPPEGGGGPNYSNM